MVVVVENCVPFRSLIVESLTVLLADRIGLLFN